MKNKKFTEKQIDLFWRFIQDGVLEYLSRVDGEIVDAITDRLHSIDEGKYFRGALTAQDAIESYDERAELGELFNLTARRIAREGKGARDYLENAAAEMGIVIVKPLESADTENRRKITDFLGIQWYSTEEQIHEALKSWL